ncbi:MAG: tetratricopeptide repeat-containing sensor histidine kinase [Bacteroidota bacterium]
MYIRFLLFFLLFLLPFWGISQEKPQRTIFQEEIIRYSNALPKNENLSKVQRFFLEKEWDSTLVYASKELKSIEKQKNSELTDFYHFLRGYSFHRKKIYQEAKRAYSVISEQFVFQPYIVAYLGEIAAELHEFEKAISYFKKIDALDSTKTLGLRKGVIETNIGACYTHLEEFDKAEYYLVKGLKIQETTKDTLKLIGSYGNIANFYYNQYKDDLAIPYFKKALQLSRKLKVKSIESFRLKSEAAENMSIVEENRKDFVKALHYRKEYEQWNDSLNNQNKIWETAQREKQEAIKEKQKEVAILKADNRTKIAERNGFIYAAIVLLIFLATGTYLYRGKIKANKMIAAQKEALDELNATKDYLFSVVSHDLRSPVNALRKQHRKLKQHIVQHNFEALKTTIDTSTTISERMHGLLNNVLHWSLEQSQQLLYKPESLVVKPIIEQVLYDFENLAKVKSIALKTSLDTALVINFDRESLKIVLRNLLDNAIKYTESNGEICITTKADMTKNCIEIRDTGIGFSEEQLERMHNLTTLTVEKIDRSRGVGLGLLLCANLIRKHHGTLTFERNLPKGSIVKITLPKT